MEISCNNNGKLHSNILKLKSFKHDNHYFIRHKKNFTHTMHLLKHASYYSRKPKNW